MTDTLLVTRPDPGGFFSKYALCFIPVLLVFLSYVTLLAMYGLTGMASPSYLGIYSMFLPDLSDVTDISILLIAPVGIFVFFTICGWILRYNEMWMSALLTLALSSLIGFLLVLWIPDPFALLGGILQSVPWFLVPGMAGNPVLYLLYWIAFLIQPLSIVSAFLVLAWTEEFRRSLQYTITSEGIQLKGGVWIRQEHMLPHSQVGRLVMERDLVGALFHTGTVIPVGLAQWGSETSIRGLGIGRQKGNVVLGAGYAKGRQEGSRQPLDCFYGIRDPEKVMALLENLIHRKDERGEEQVSYLKKIHDKL